MKLTRKQELHLIDLGLTALIERALQPTAKPNAKPQPPAARWTKEQRRKFSTTMKRKWKEKKKIAAKINGGS